MNPVTVPEWRLPISRQTAQQFGSMKSAAANPMASEMTAYTGFQEAKPQLAVSELTMNLTGPIFSIADLVLRNGKIVTMNAAVLSDTAAFRASSAR
ncbi:MAG: hypothetical protein ABSB32_15200, partial [Thermodesulfobacteriota bacterium]